MYSSSLMHSSNLDQVMDTSRSNNDSVFSSGKPDEANRSGFLFGNKRRMAVSTTPNFLNTSGGVSAPSTDIFASPAPSAFPSHIREAVQGSAKSVHWSPSLVQEERAGMITASPVPKPTNIPHTTNYSSPSMNAPPLRSLRDEVEPVKKAARRSMSMPVNHTTVSKLSTSFANDNNTSTTESPADTWVTVFGFPSEQASNVLKFFSRHGEVVSHQIPSKGNWMHVRYSCAVHARQALSRNGSILDGVLRVGVVPCTEKDLIGSEPSRPVSVLSRSTMEQSIREEPEPEEIPALSERDQNISALETSLNASRFGSISRSGMRSLASTYEARGGSLRIPNPAKQESIMNKIWNAVGF